MTHVQVHMGPHGRIVIPAEFRRTLNMEPGSTLVAYVAEGNRLVLEDHRAHISRLRGAWRHLLPTDRNPRAELEAERAAEAEQAESHRGGGSGARPDTVAPPVAAPASSRGGVP